MGQRSISSSTNLGKSERAAHSAERSRTCCSVGTSPVRRSQKSPAKTGQDVCNTCTRMTKQTFGQRLFSAGRLGQKLLAFRNGLATEANAFLRVQNRAFPDEALDATRTAVDLIESDLVNDLGTMLSFPCFALVRALEPVWARGLVVLPEGLDLVDLFGEKLCKAFLQGLNPQEPQSFIMPFCKARDRGKRTWVLEE